MPVLPVGSRCGEIMSEHHHILNLGAALAFLAPLMGAERAATVDGIDYRVVQHPRSGDAVDRYRTPSPGHSKSDEEVTVLRAKAVVWQFVCHGAECKAPAEELTRKALDLRRRADESGRQRSRRQRARRKK